MTNKDGGPAFPQVVTDKAWQSGYNHFVYDVHSVGGMSIRDYLAGQVIIGWMATGTKDIAIAAAAAYEVADAMLQARDQGRRNEDDKPLNLIALAEAVYPGIMHTGFADLTHIEVDATKVINELTLERDVARTEKSRIVTAVQDEAAKYTHADHARCPRCVVNDVLSRIGVKK
jgi:hypothetical protein